VLSVLAPIRTERLLLREWSDADLAPFAEMNADPAVMEFFPGALSREESDAAAARLRNQAAERGFGLYAVEVPGRASFVGFVGLMAPTFQAHFTPCVEVGWRLARAYWKHGYATEGARAALRFGFEHLDLGEIVSMTVPDNVRSRHVMEKLGMIHDPAGDFDHPRVPVGNPRRRHVLYRLTQAAWRAAPGA
jgi:RimJ/RimL family protein N-acetyltransferase